MLPVEPVSLPPVAPPEAEPDFEGSLVVLLPGELEGELLLGALLLGELLLEPGLVAEPLEGLDPLMPDEPELPPGLEGVVALLPLPVLPLVLLPASSWPQAARPKAMATAIASVETFMCPPWLGYRFPAANIGPGIRA